jgi:rhodanese-related sulfurtransferase
MPCPFSCLSSASGPTLAKAAAIVLAACGIAAVDSAQRPIKTDYANPNLAVPAAAALPDAPVTTNSALNPNPPAGVPSTTPATTSPSRAEPAPAAPTAQRDASMLTIQQAYGLFEQMLTRGDVHFVDARSETDFKSGHIPTAFNIPPEAFFGGQIPDALAQMSRTNTVVVYCGGGNCDASKLTAIRLTEQGFTTVYVFEEGMTGWKANNLPTQ